MSLRSECAQIHGKWSWGSNVIAILRYGRIASAIGDSTHLAGPNTVGHPVHVQSMGACNMQNGAVGQEL
eukprot:46002-Eustigmatos_ZCMA.PRE.1